MIPKIGIGIILMGIIIMIAAFAVPSLTIVYIGSASSGGGGGGISAPGIDYLSDIPYSQSIANPSNTAYTSSNMLVGQFLFYDPHVTGSYPVTVTWYIASVEGSSEQFNTSLTQHYNANFINGNATTNVSSPYNYQENVEFSVYLILTMNYIFTNGSIDSNTFSYRTPTYYGEFTSNGNSSGAGLVLYIMYTSNNKDIIYNAQNASGSLNIPYQTTIQLEYYKPYFGPLSNVVVWLTVNGKYQSISPNTFHDYTIRPGNNTIVLGYNNSANGVSIVQITEYVNVANNFNVTTLIIGIVVTFFGVVVLVGKRI